MSPQMKAHARELADYIGKHPVPDAPLVWRIIALTGHAFGDRENELLERCVKRLLGRRDIAAGN